MNILCATEPATGDPDCPACRGHARSCECPCVMASVTDAERAERECLRRVRAIAEKHGTDVLDVEKAVAELANSLVVPKVHVIASLEDMDRLPHAGAFEFIEDE